MSKGLAEQIGSVDFRVKQREAELQEHLAQGPPARGSAASPITWLFEPGSFVPMARLLGDGAQAVVTDHLGTPMTMLDRAGAVTWSASIDTYGVVHHLRRGSRLGCPFRFQGQYEDGETGLFYNRFRYYDPEGGGYISQDPNGLAGGLRVYGYVDDPTGWIDPWGLAGGCGQTTGSTAKGRSGALNEAKRDLGIPRGQQPDAVNRVKMTNRDGSSVLGQNGKPIVTREYTYTRSDGSKVVIQDHSAGHQFGAGGVGDQEPHSNVRPPENTRTGTVPGAREHYEFRR